MTTTNNTVPAVSSSTFTIGWEVFVPGREAPFFAHTESEAVKLSSQFGHDRCRIVKITMTM